MLWSKGKLITKTCQETGVHVFVREKENMVAHSVVLLDKKPEFVILIRAIVVIKPSTKNA